MERIRKWKEERVRAAVQKEGKTGCGPYLHSSSRDFFPSFIFAQCVFNNITFLFKFIIVCCIFVATDAINASPPNWYIDIWYIWKIIIPRFLILLCLNVYWSWGSPSTVWPIKRQTEEDRQSDTQRDRQEQKESQTVGHRETAGQRERQTGESGIFFSSLI